MTTLVIGADGNIGRNVLAQLMAAGEPVRAAVLDPATANRIPAGVPVVAADLTQVDTLHAAFEGVKKVFSYTVSGGAKAFAAAARTAVLEHVVLLSSGSVLLPWAENNLIAREHRKLEEMFAAAGVRYTPIRPLVLAPNALSWRHSIRSEGAVRLYLPEARTAPVDERDIAGFASAALLGDDSPYISGLLTGGESISQRRQVEIIGEVVGRTIAIEDLSEGQALEDFGRLMPLEVARAVLEFHVVALDEGGSPGTDIVQHVLGRPARTFEQWAEHHAGDFR